MFPPADMFSLSTLFSAYASITYIIMLIRTLFDDLIPHQVQNFLWSKFGFLFNPRSSCSSSQLTLVIDEYTRNGYGYRNKLYKASQLFLGTKITPSIKKIIVNKFCRDKGIMLTIPAGEEVIDIFEGIQVKWKLIANNPDDNDDEENSGNSFEVEFHKKDREKVLSYYLAYVLSIAKALKQEIEVRKLHTIEPRCSYWQSVILEHPATFDTLAIDHKLKREIIEDLDKFVRRRELYKKVGKAWKRGYLLYGPPGTGKSTLVAAMANYLKFDVYDMELSSVHSNDDLRRYLLETTNRSILLIEDIDCSINLQNREQDSEDDDSDEDDNSDEDDDDSEPHGSKNKVTLSGLLNFADGLWSSCGDERIIIFTTNHKDRLDEALLRPGRMDMHIHLSYCTTEGFNILALNYLGLHKNTDKLYSEIEASIEKCQVTPAEVAEELMKSEDVDIALGGLLTFLKRKEVEQSGKDQNKDDALTLKNPKKTKIENKEVKKIVRPRRWL